MYGIHIFLLLKHYTLDLDLRFRPTEQSRSASVTATTKTLFIFTAQEKLEIPRYCYNVGNTYSYTYPLFIFLKEEFVNK